MRKTRSKTFLQETGYKAYISGELWEKKRKKIREKYPMSYYCFVCDCTQYLELHHEGYDTVPFEKFYRDLFWLCGTRCGHECHLLVQQGSDGYLLYDRPSLRLRRLEERRRFVRRNLRPSTLFHFAKRFLYRLLY